MSTSYSFDIQDTSPLVTFVPPTLGPVPIPDDPTADLPNGWQTLFDGRYLDSLGQVGLGNSTSTHVTSRDGASFELSFTGTSITLVGLANDSSYDIVLDGLTTTNITPSPPSSSDSPLQVLYSRRGLAEITHSLKLVVHTSNTESSFVAFDKATVEVNSNRTSQVTQTVIPSTSLSFVGSWTFQQQPPAFPLFSNTSLLTYHTSSSSGDTAIFTFQNQSPQVVSLSVLGVLNFLNGLYKVTISEVGGSSVSQSFNGSFGWECGSQLFLASGLEQTLGNNLTLTVTNLENKPLMIAGLNVTTAEVSPLPGPSSSSAPSAPISTSSATSTPSADHSGGLHISVPTGTLIALILSCLCILALILLSACLYTRFRRRRRARRLEMMKPSNGSAGAVAVSEKSKSSSSDSVLDIGRPVPAHDRSRSGSTGNGNALGVGGDTTTATDRYTPAPPSLRRSRHLSFPRTVMTASDRNGGGGGAGTPGYSQPYTNYTYAGPSLKARSYSPFIFSFDTSNSNSNKSRSRSQSDNSDPAPQSSPPLRSDRELSSSQQQQPSIIGTATTTDPRSSYQTRQERSSAFTKLTGEAKSTFLELDHSRPQISSEDLPPGGTDRNSQPPDVPTGVAPGGGDEYLSSPTDDTGPRFGTGPRIHIPRKPPPSSSLPPQPPPEPEHPQSDSPRSEALVSTRSSQHPYVYGYAYQPSVSGDSDNNGSGGSQQQHPPDHQHRPSSTTDLPQHPYGLQTQSQSLALPSSHLLPTSPHPYAQPTTPPSATTPLRRVSHPPEVSPIETAASGETDMIFSHPEAEGGQRRRPPGIELGEVMTDED